VTDWWATDPAQRAAAEDLGGRIEAAVGGDPADIEGLRGEVEAADLHERDRADLQGRCFQYLADVAKARMDGDEVNRLREEG
jgi:hypothetical protein